MILFLLMVYWIKYFKKRELTRLINLWAESDE